MKTLLPQPWFDEFYGRRRFGRLRPPARWPNQRYTIYLWLIIIHIDLYEYIEMYAYMCIYVYICVYMCVYIYTYIHTHIYTSIYLCIYIYIYTHSHVSITAFWLLKKHILLLRMGPEARKWPSRHWKSWVLAGRRWAGRRLNGGTVGICGGQRKIVRFWWWDVTNVD